MMRHRPSRLPALFLAVVFLLLGAGDVFGLHSCPHHEGLSTGAEHATDGSAHHHAGHGEDAPADEGEHAGPCLCGGSCPAASLAFVPDSSVSLVETFPAESQPVGVRPVTVVRDTVLPFFLPYAQAPPPIS